MTSYVTREEYERLCARIEQLESVKFDVRIDVAAADDAVAKLVRDGVAKGLEDWRRGFPYSAMRA